MDFQKEIINMFEFIKKYFKKRNKKKFRKSINSLPLKERFSKIYAINYWGNSESVSGKGSTVEHTEKLREFLPYIFKKYKVGIVFDAPCGDFNWMRLVVDKLDVNYLGADIVPELIKNNKQNYQTEKISFIEMDLTKDLFPNADLMICRDCLFHLSFEDTKKLLKNFLDSNIEYLLTTTYANKSLFVNTDIVSGHFRLIDLTISPYNFPSSPLEMIEDWKFPDHKRFMYLWSRQQVKSAIENFNTL